MSDYAALNALRKAERELTKLNAELAAKNRRLETDLADMTGELDIARGRILQMQAAQS